MKKYKLGEILTISSTSITPQAGRTYHLYSLPSFDDGKVPEITKGENIHSNKCVISNRCILFNKLNVRFKRIWKIENNTPNKLCSTEFLPLIIDESIIDYQYCYYLLASDYLTNYLCGINSNTSGSHKRINPDILLNLEVTLPVLDEQKHIGSILANLDRKIDLNRSINHNLEAMAKQLYDYWFVQFDFPDENGKPYKSSGGKMVWNEKLKREIPEGWHCFRLNEIEPNIVTGKTPSTTDETNFGGAIPFITIDDIRKSRFVFQTTRTLSEKGAYSQLRKYIPIGSLCCSCIGTVGILGFVGKRGQTNQQLNTVVFENEYNKEYIYFSLGLYFRYASAKVGNILPNMSKDDFSKILLLYPTKNLVMEYHKKVKNLFNQIECIIANIESLTKQRDSLLPLLMNGQVSLNYDLSNDWRRFSYQTILSN